MKYPEDLKIKLCNDKPSRISDGSIAYMLTPVGSSLSTLAAMWDMSYEQIIEKIAYEAAVNEERFIVDGKYVKPHRRMVPSETDYA
jgi:hypothetical protein